MEGQIINMKVPLTSGKLQIVIFLAILLGAFVIISIPTKAHAAFDPVTSCALPYVLTAPGDPEVGNTVYICKGARDNKPPIDLSTPDYAKDQKACKDGGGDHLAIIGYYGKSPRPVCVDANGKVVATGTGLLPTTPRITTTDKNQPPKPPGTCNWVDGNFSFNTCIWYPLVAVVSATLISMSAWILALAGVSFSWLIDYTILLFSTLIYEPLKDAINIGWNAFLGPANIVIIGMIIFMAIMTIFGNKEYGYKQLLARILVIAIFINFSLLFTKIIIDVSNYTAAQFYALTHENKKLSEVLDEANQRVRGTGNIGTDKTGTSLLQGGYATEGMAAEFVRYLGVTSFADTGAVMAQGLINNQGTGKILMHALFATVFLLLAAIALFFGCYYLIQRAVAFLLLMVTAAIAFATHLHPKLSEGKYGPFGWSAWWKSLLGNAFLAPLLMIFLYVTLQISRQLNNSLGGRGSLGQLALGNISDGANLQMVFNYIVILSLLFFSIKISASISKAAGGYGLSFSSIKTAGGATYDFGKKLFKRDKPKPKPQTTAQQPPFAIPATGAPAATAQRMNQTIRQILPQYGRAQARVAPVAAAPTAGAGLIVPTASRARTPAQQLRIQQAAAGIPTTAPATPATPTVPRPPAGPVVPPAVATTAAAAGAGNAPAFAASQQAIAYATQAAQQAGQAATHMAQAGQAMTETMRDSKDALRGFSKAAQSLTAAVQEHSERMEQAATPAGGGNANQERLITEMRNIRERTREGAIGVKQLVEIAKQTPDASLADRLQRKAA